MFWYFYQNIYFGINDKNYDMYMFHEFLSICIMLQKCLNIMFLYLDEFLDKTYFLFQVIENTSFGFW